MSSIPLNYSCGRPALKQYLKKNPLDLREMSLSKFKEWLTRSVERKRERDPIFVQREKIRNLERDHADAFQACFQAIDAASRAYDAGGLRSRLEVLENELIGAQKALVGISGALENSKGEAAKGLRKKLQGFEERKENLLQEQAKLQATPEYQAWKKATDALTSLRESTGIVQEEQTLEELNRQSAQRRQRTGVAFEDQVGEVVHREILPVLARYTKGSGIPANIHVLQGVKLGAARAELDYVVVRRFQKPGKPVRVLAVIEAKRDINDIPKGFTQRQENLAWFTGDQSGYDVDATRTKVYRSGHFDQPAVHEEDGQEFHFDVSSFSYFQREPDSGFFLKRLYFLTDSRPLRGMQSSEDSRFFYKVGRDLDFDLESEEYLEDLHHWLCDILSPLQTRDILQIFLKSPAISRQFIRIHRPPKKTG